LQALEQLSTELGPDKLLLLEYHTQDIYTTAATQAAFLAYGVTGTPTVIFDGSSKVLGGDKVVQDDYNMYRGKINTELAKPNAVVIAATKSLEGSTLQINVQLTNISSQALSGIQLLGVTYSDQGKSMYRAIVNDVSSPVTANVALGETQNLQLTLTKPTSLVQSVVLVKSAGVIIQAVMVS
jgi:hypothetical protein